MDGGDKIQLFKLSRKICQNIGLFSPKSNESCNLINSKKWFFLFCLVPHFISPAAYLFFKAHSMIEYAMVFYACTTVILCIVLYLAFALQAEEFLNYFKNYEQFIEKRTHSMIVYKNTNGKIERIMDYLACVVVVNYSILLLVPLFYTIVSYYFLYSGKQSFFLFFPTWWPFDWKTPFGYLVAWLGQCAGFIASGIISMVCFDFSLGSFWLLIANAEDIRNDVAAFNNTVKILKHKAQVSDHAELMERFRGIIAIYSDAKQLINEYNELNQFILLSCFSWNMINIPSLLMTLQFQLEDDDSKLFEIMILSISALWLLAADFIICEPGERVSVQFEQFEDEFGRCNWNKLSIDMQRMYLIFASDTQQPKLFRSYGGIQCTRETFKKIITNGFSYFMALRRIRA